MTKQPVPNLIDYGLSFGFEVRRETADRRRVQLRHKVNGALVIVPKSAFDLGRDRCNYRTLIRRLAKGAR